MNDQYTPIHNEILEALCQINLSPYETRCLFVIWRKTYGFISRETGLRKKEDYISLSQFSELTKLDKRNVSRALKGLKEKNIISRDDKKTSFSKKFLKILSSVEMINDNDPPSVAMMTPLSSDDTIISSDDKTPSVAMYTKEKKETNTKETITKESKEPLSSVDDFTLFLEKFNELFGKAYKPTAQRKKKFVLRLKTYSLDEINLALENLSKSPFHRGVNQRGWQADPDFLLRSDEQIDKFINYSPDESRQLAGAARNAEQRFNNKPTGGIVFD